MSEAPLSDNLTADDLPTLLRRQTSAYPIALLVVGANDDEKQSMICRLSAEFDAGKIHFARLQHGDSVEDVLHRGIFGSHAALFVDVARGISRHASVRPVVIRRLREIGAKTVVTVWVDVPDPDAARMEATAGLGFSVGFEVPDSIFNTLRAAPPNLDEGADLVLQYPT